jgi:two-component system LytT family response regulator
MRVLVVDDELPARRRLTRMLAALDGIAAVDEATSSLEALAAVERARPDLLLLDIHMPGLDGLSLAARYADLPPVVFVTAHDEHAVAAFAVHAVDYLLKPVRPQRLAEAIDRARTRGPLPPGAFNVLRSPARSTAPRVVTHQRGEIRFFDALTVTRFWAEAKYTMFRAHGGEHLTTESLSALADPLTSHGFVRVHRRELVRGSAIRALRLTGGVHTVELDDGQTPQVGRRAVAALKRLLGDTE